MSEPEKTRLSVIIPCLNEAEYVPKLLQDLAQQDIDEPFEVIVADSSSDDNTLEVARTFSDKLNLRTTNTNRLSAAHTRNAGAEIASGDYFVFIDADCHIKNHFLRTLMANRDEHDADMMTTHLTAQGWNLFDKRYYYASSKYGFLPSFKQGQPIMTGAIQFVDRQLHEQVGGFKDALTVGEDIDYSQAIATIARRPHFVESLKVYASNRRFKTDGRLTMILRSAKWVGGGSEFDDDQLDSFEFGHYKSASKKIRIRDLFLQPKLGRLLIKALWLQLKSGLANL